MFGCVLARNKKTPEGGGGGGGSNGTPAPNLFSLKKAQPRVKDDLKQEEAKTVFAVPQFDLLQLINAIYQNYRF